MKQVIAKSSMLMIVLLPAVAMAPTGNPNCCRKVDAACEACDTSGLSVCDQPIECGFASGATFLLPFKAPQDCLTYGPVYQKTCESPPPAGVIMRSDCGLGEGQCCYAPADDPKITVTTTILTYYADAEPCGMQGGSSGGTP